MGGRSQRLSSVPPTSSCAADTRSCDTDRHPSRSRTAAERDNDKVSVTFISFYLILLHCICICIEMCSAISLLDD